MSTHDTTNDANDITALLGAYALDAVDELERARVERHLASDPAARAEVDAHRSVAAVLAESVEAMPSTPSPLVWERIAGSISGKDEPAPPLEVPARARTRWVPRLVAAVSMAAVLVSAVLVAQVIDRNRQIDELTAALEGDRLAQAAAAAVEAPGSRVVSLESEGGIEVRVVVDQRGIGYVLQDNLPALGTDRTYQLWAIVDDRVISAGVLGNDPGISPFQVVGDLAGLAITEEVEGGVVSSENEAVAVWLRDA